MKTKSPINTRALVIGMSLAVGLAGISMVSAQTTQPTPERQTRNVDHDSEQPVSDTWITTKVKTELATTDNVSSMDISVTTVNGVVTLTGVLESQAEVDRAVAAVRGVEGVTRVDSSGLRTR